MDATGWWGLLDVYAQRAYERAAEHGAPPRACPNDGEPLTVGHCPFDGWRWGPGPRAGTEDDDP